MKKILFSLMMVAVLLLSACGAKAGTAGGKITLRLWGHQDPGFQKANDALIVKFKAANPNIDVKYETFSYDDYIQKLQTSMAAGDVADVIELFGTWTCSYALGGRLKEVPTSLMTYDQAAQIFYKAPLDGYYCGGKLYGFPFEFNQENGGALVNPALFEKHNVPYPPKWNTFADMIADAQKMTEYDASGKMMVSGFDFVTSDGLPATLFAGILEQGGSYFAADGKHFNFDTPEARKTIQMMVDLVQKDKVVDPVLFNDTTNEVSTSFFTGNIAIGFRGSWAAGTGVVDYPDMKFGYVEIPTYFGGERHFAADSGWGEVVSANTKHSTEAWKFVQFMTTVPENAMSYNIDTRTIPAMKANVEKPAALLAEAPYMQATFDLLPHGQYVGNVTNHDQLFYEIIYPDLLEALQGVTTVDEAAKKINTDANAMVDAS
jgi:multiple sugar transport system substrate-binding protein